MFCVVDSKTSRMARMCKYQSTRRQALVLPSHSLLGRTPSVEVFVFFHSTTDVWTCVERYSTLQRSESCSVGLSAPYNPL